LNKNKELNFRNLKRNRFLVRVGLVLIFRHKLQGACPE
jgi:hypothetical protein